ncbi:alpha/beta fold hydrolase [Streptomyces sp. NPDC019396]|uniref:alpha/beta hydrolase family protein n=1 Tax=Streptomyces sp. NPDC019396 TaxID=3154687 RepID=UPI0033E66B63
MISRISFRFSADGSRAVCLAADTTGRYHAESWTLHGDGPRRDFAARLNSGPAYIMALPLDTGRLLISRHGAAGIQILELLHRDGQRTPVGTHSGPPLRLLPAPETAGCLAFAWPSGGNTGNFGAAGRLYAVVEAATPWLREVARLPGPVLDAAVCGHRLLLTVGQGSGGTRVLVDPSSGAPEPAPFLDPRSHVLATAGERVLLASRGPAGAELVLADLATGTCRALDPEGELPGVAHPVALDPTGTSVAVIGTLGARSVLSRWDTVTGAVHPVPLPEGELLPSAAWTSAGLWLPYAGPGHPRSLAWSGPDADRLHVPVSRTGPWVPARLETFPGAEGPVEAVVHGPDWRTSPRVVVALHGGPSSRWTLGFEPLFQALAAAGITVVAPNQRGSTGYGAAHTLAIVGAWGVPDLADVAAAGAHIARERAPGLEPPAVFGISYGGYLALLAAATQPGTWSACVAVAPFLSGPRLHADGFTTVRGMVERLDGLTPADDAIGPRDVERLAPGLRAPLLLVHGARDESTPVSHSRALAERLTALGRRDGADFRYLELPDHGHAAIGAAVGDPVTAVVTRFLAEGGGTTRPGRPPSAERR